MRLTAGATTMMPMNRAVLRRSPGLTLALVLFLAACRASASPPASTAEPPASLPASASPTADATATAQPTATPDPTPSASASGELTAFPIAPNPDADALFVDRDECENLTDGYRVQFPDAWWTNTAIGEVGPCAWFSPTFYEVADPAVVPAAVAITIEWMEGDSGSFSDEISRQFGLIGRTQPAVRVEYELAGGGRYLVYQVQLGPTPEQGPNLLATTSTDMGGEYELNKAVLDRIMATMEFLGTTQ